MLDRVHRRLDLLAVFGIPSKTAEMKISPAGADGVAVGVAHLGIGERVHVALAVERPHLDDAFARLDAVGAGIHAQRAADGAGNAVIEMKAADAGLERQRRDALVRASRRPP